MISDVYPRRGDIPCVLFANRLVECLAAGLEVVYGLKCVPLFVITWSGSLVNVVYESRDVVYPGEFPARVWV